MSNSFPKSKLPLYQTSVDWEAMFSETPPPDVWYENIFKWSRDELRAYQNRHFLKIMETGWNNAFYSRRWKEAGLERSDIRGLDDLGKLPIFDSEDVKRSIEESPSFGQVCGLEVKVASKTQPLKIQTSGGTTGMPRPTLFDARAWEYNGANIAREIYAQGGRPGDIMQIPATLSLANMGWSYYWACHHYLGIIPVTTGSGLVTPSRRQLEYAFAFGTNLWASFPEYLTQLAKVCREELGRDVRELNTKFITTYLGPDLDNSLRSFVEDLWGCPVYDNYGTHEVGGVAFEAVDKDGLYLMEDVGVFEILDVDNNQAVEDGQAGNIVFTHLHRTVPPLIRYNLKDLARVKSSKQSSLGSYFRRMDKFLGRSDQMIKIRGVNIYPMACLSAVRSDDRTTGEWICVAERISRDGVLRDELTVVVETKDACPLDGLRQHLEARLHNDLGIKLEVKLVSEGQLPDTNVGGEGKPRRLIDKRKTFNLASPKPRPN